MKPINLLFLCLFSFAAPGAESPSLKLTQTFPLPGVKGRFDHFAIDVKGERLFAAALGNNSLEVIDVKEGKRLKSISGLRKPTGVVFLADLNQIGVANGDDGSFKLFDGVSYELVSVLRGLDDADNVRRDPKTKLIYVGYGDGALAVLDPGGRKKIGDIKLSGHPESFQLESNGPRIFVNVPDAKQIAIIDRQKQTVVATWPMKEFKANFPMALDETNHRLFVGCRQPARLVILDLASGKALGDVKISDDTDDLFYDAKEKRIYISCGEGFLDVLGISDANQAMSLLHLPTRGGARTSFFSPDLGRVYLGVPRYNLRDAELQVYAVGATDAAKP